MITVAVLRGQDAAKVTPSVTNKIAIPAISDKDRASFLLVQRDWLTTQRQYEDAFKKEPVVAKYDSKAQELAKICQGAGYQFDAKDVQCVKPEVASTVPSVPSK